MKASLLCLIVIFTDTLYGQQCTVDDFSVLYSGVPFFTVNSRNGSYTCASYIASAVTTSTLNVTGSASIAGLCSAPCIQAIASQGTTTAGVVAQLQSTISAQNATISALLGSVASLQAQVLQLQLAQARSCKQYLQTNAAVAGSNGQYQLWNPSSQSQFAAYCDMSTNGGGWTLVWKAAQIDYATTSFAYLPNMAAVLSGATEMMMAFVDASNVLSQPWKFPMPAAFATTNPLGIGPCNYNLVTATRLADMSSVSGYLRVGTANFGAYCDEGCHDGRSNYGNSPYGQVCFTQKQASWLGYRNPDAGVPLSFAGYSDFPHYSGFSVSNNDWCANSNQAYSASLCSASRLFAIFVR